jgi:Sulfotransferase family
LRKTYRQHLSIDSQLFFSGASMSKAKDSYKELWTPPPRPEWVQRLNDEGTTMNLSGVVPLDEDSLIRSATEATGLSDFGSDDWREPFRVLIKSLEEESNLNLMGRLWARDELLLLLQARLQVEDTYKRHPEIDEEEIVQPIIILGQGRSGTSFTQNMLTEIPENKSLLTWESMFPCPPPEETTYETDPRINRADEIAKRFIRVTPTKAAMHEYGALMPQECCEVMSMSFRAPAWLGLLGQVPSYFEYMAKNDFSPALKYHKRVLKLLQWKNPRERWILKDNFQLDRLGETLKTYPDACFIWAHRDPLKAFASVISLIGTTQWGRTDTPLVVGGYEFVIDMDIAAQRLNNVIDQLEAGVVPPNQIYHSLYHELIKNPIGTIDKIYAHFGIELSDPSRQAVVEYLEANPRTSRPTHKMNLGTDEDIAIGRKAFQRYQDYFNIPSEF